MREFRISAGSKRELTMKKPKMSKMRMDETSSGGLKTGPKDRMGASKGKKQPVDKKRPAK